MTDLKIKRSHLVRYAVLAAFVAITAGYFIARLMAPTRPPASAPRGRILYWYDPMIPDEHHDGPGLSSMNMTLIPKYADEAAVQGQSSPGAVATP